MAQAVTFRAFGAETHSFQGSRYHGKFTSRIPSGWKIE